MAKQIYPDIKRISCMQLKESDLKKIRDEVCEEFGITAWEIKSKKRNANIVEARYEFAMKAKGKFTYVQIGEFINRSHSAISHYANKYTPVTVSQ